MKTLLLLTLIAVLFLLSACGLTRVDPRCRSYDYCPYTDSPRSYTHAPAGSGGKYCQQNPERC